MHLMDILSCKLQAHHLPGAAEKHGVNSYLRSSAEAVAVASLLTFICTQTTQIYHHVITILFCVPTS